MLRLCLLACVFFPGITLADSALRDPMRPYLSTPKAAVEQQHFVVNAIFVSPRRKLAIVNGKRVRIGEKVQGATVKDIQADRLIVTLDGRTITLKLGGGSDI